MGKYIDKHDRFIAGRSLDIIKDFSEWLKIVPDSEKIVQNYSRGMITLNKAFHALEDAEKKAMEEDNVFEEPVWNGCLKTTVTLFETANDDEHNSDRVVETVTFDATKALDKIPFSELPKHIGDIEIGALDFGVKIIYLSDYVLRKDGRRLNDWYGGVYVSMDDDETYQKYLQYRHKRIEMMKEKVLSNHS